MHSAVDSVASLDFQRATPTLRRSRRRGARSPRALAVPPPPRSPPATPRPGLGKFAVSAAFALPVDDPLAPEPLSQTWLVQTEVFDGPLDLLLYLVKRDGIDLRRVSIARICDSYLGFLDRLRDLQVAIASDYLVMAATLVHLKSLELLPRPPVILEEDDVDPKEQLAQRLETYAQFKAASEALERRAWLDRDTFVRAPQDVGEVEQPLVPGVDAFALLDLYYKVLVRPAAPEPVHTIHKPDVDLGDCCRRVLKRLGGPGGRVDLTEVLRIFERRAERVVSFLAMLEMCRLGWILLVQAGHLQPVEVVSGVPVDQRLDAIRGEALGFSAVPDAGAAAEAG